MSIKCANCGSRDTVDRLDNVQCQNCGTLTGYDGEAKEFGASQEVRDVIDRHNQPGVPTVVGNLADLQRAGADVATGEGTFESAVEVPAGAIHPADEDAAQGGITKETIRTGIHTEEDLAQPGPGQNKDESHSVDPGSQSPVPVEGSPKKTGDAAVKAEAKAKESA